MPSTSLSRLTVTLLLLFASGIAWTAGDLDAAISVTWYACIATALINYRPED